MNLIAKGKYVILIPLEKEETVKNKSGILLIDKGNTESMRYRVHHSGKSKIVSKGDVVVLNGYAQHLEIEGQQYFIVAEEGIAAVIE